MQQILMGRKNKPEAKNIFQTSMTPENHDEMQQNYKNRHKKLHINWIQ